MLFFQVAACRRWLPLLALLFSFILSAAAKPYGVDVVPQTGAFLDDTLPEIAPSISGNWTAINAFTNLLFTNSVGLTHVPDSDLLCVWEREGRVWFFQNSPGTTEKKLVLDIHDQCQGWDDSGLLGVAFHPGFATNHLMFVYYTWVKPGTVVGDPYTRPNPVLPNTYHDRLERYTLDVNNIAQPDSVKVFVDLTNQTVWHHGGGIFFHSVNGLLYWTDGDNSVADNDQFINKSLYSGVFRIDVDRRGGNFSHPPPRQPLNGYTANYYIPNDNPFVGQSNVLEEFFCLGLRSPHRMTIDPVTGRIFIGDVGESSREEIDSINPGESGLNFQWNYCEGNLGTMKSPYIGISRGPVLDYPHTDGRAVIGGYVYRGKQFATDLGGKYIFGDNVFRTIWALDETATPPKKTLLCVMPKGTGPNSGTDYTGLSSFGTDADGEIYFCQMSSQGGSIYRLQRGGPPPPKKAMPQLLSETGVFTDAATMQPADFLMPYGVNSPLWSDGAVKKRWVALPKNLKIDFSVDGEWKFPEGTVFVKHFSLPVDDTDPTVLRRLETRLLIRDSSGGIYGASYKWRSDNSDADLVMAGTNEIINIKTATGIRQQKWFYPGRQDCLTCHTPVSGGVLGIKTSQLNGDYTYSSGITDNQLRTWNHLGWFSQPLRDSRFRQMPRLVSISDTHAPLRSRVRSYLDANCSQCHRPGGVEAFFDARYETQLPQQNIINGPVGNLLGTPGARIVVPANLDKSLLYHRIGMVGENQMPPIAKNVVDTNAVAVFAQWILSLPIRSAPLPPGWMNRDIGDVGMSGDASFLNGRFNLLASGTDIWGYADAFHFVYRPLNGNGQIIARVTSMQYTDPWCKAGVMMREGLGSDAKDVLMALSGQGGSTMQWRPISGDRTSGSVDGPPAKLPYWVKLTRVGDVFTGYVSGDGADWRMVSTATVPMNKSLLVGLAITAHNNTVLNSTLFEQVAFKTGIPRKASSLDGQSAWSGFFGSPKN
jgi:uncharacterized repeat protein (TIGR03806 family)